MHRVPSATLSSLLLASVALVGGCGAPPVDPEACPEQGPGAEVCRLEAVVEGRAGADTCGALQSPEVRDACWMGVARAERSLDRCAAIAHDAYREHCGLELLERKVTVLDPGAWAAACGRWTGSMAPHCLQHGVEMWARGMTGREGRPAFRSEELGPAFAAIYRAAAQAGVDRGLRDPDPYESVDRLYLHLVAAAEPGRERLRCQEQGLPRTVCAEATEIAAQPYLGLRPDRLRWRGSTGASWY